MVIEKNEEKPGVANPDWDATVPQVRGVGGVA